ncbi:MAG: hypothetical protein Q8888_02575, partial [Vigna little leaf phytoplasma]|nr:hypothetical protein [Vigna little leaf phytoplasma]
MFLFNFFKLKFNQTLNKFKTIGRPQNYITAKIKTQCPTETTTAEVVCTKNTIIKKTLGLLGLSFLTGCALFLWLQWTNTTTTIYQLGLGYTIISVIFGLLLFY